jgi:hypothetical protein
MTWIKKSDLKKSRRASGEMIKGPNIAEFAVNATLLAIFACQANLDQ